jgi:phosphomannomutase
MGRVADLSAIFKAYDVRGLVPSQLDTEVSTLIGSAFAREVWSAAGDPPDVVVGHDMRPSSPALVDAFAEGVRATGAGVTLIGLASTDQLYFASGSLGVPGAMVTASHNPSGYNGIKLCRAGAVAMSAETGLGSIQRRVAGGEDAGLPAIGPVQRRDVLDDYAGYLHRLAPVAGRRLKVVVDAANGMAGHTVPAVFADLDVDLVPMYFELDGTFPHHEANPLDTTTLTDLQARVRDEQADLGLAFDGDADRCFAVDETGALVSPSAMTGLIAERALAGEPGAHVIHNLITSKAVPELILARGGIPVRTKVGHSLIKATMAEHDAVFGGEHSGHFYFRDFWFADSGMLAALHLLSAVAATDVPVSRLMAVYAPYTASGEINRVVPDVDAVLDRLDREFSDRTDVSVDHLDGVTVIGKDWWFNVRASNTEPVVRLNVEAEHGDDMVAVRDHVLALLRSDG